MSSPEEGSASTFSTASSAASPSTSSSSHSLPQPPSAPSSVSVAAVGRECAKCLSYLTRALDGSGGGTLGAMMSSSTESSSSSSSRPATLLRALGVIAPIDGRTNESESNNNNNNSSNPRESSIISNTNKIYELMPNGRGVTIRLENNHAVNNNNTKDAHDLQHRKSIAGVPRDTVQQNNHKQEQQQHQHQNQHPIHRRVSNAASHLANNNNNNSNIQEGSGHSKGVLTTSPLSSDPSITHASQGTSSSTTKESSSITITIECSPCGSDTRAEACARAYVRGPDPLGIVLCSNRLSSQREIEEVLVHELVHIYDVHVRQMDLRDCKQLAYSEVRAAREAECGNRMTSFTTNICAKDRAIVATRNMFPEEGKKCVCDVFDAAVKDYAPFLVNSASGGGIGVGGGVGPNRGSSSSKISSVSAPSPLPSPRQSDR